MHLPAEQISLISHCALEVQESQKFTLHLKSAGHCVLSLQDFLQKPEPTPLL